MPIKPFLTPEFTSEDIQCRTLKTPANKEWLGVFNSALLEMLNPYNWEQVKPEHLTIEEAIAIIEPILIEYFATPGCSIGETCLQPDGLRVLRLNASGHIQELADGVWQPPTGDYEIPPVEPREESTAYDRRCAAAANAENVLATVYEMVSDMVAEDADETEVAIAVAAAFAALLGAAFGFVLPALIGIFFLAWKAFLEIVEFMTADLWDEDFSTLLRCLLFNCSSDDADVVTFDFQCLLDQMAASVDLTGIDALTQLRLFGQVSFMLNIIGADGLNIAGTTTEITTFDCDDCGGWCYEFDFDISEQGWIPREDNPIYATYIGTGWEGNAGGTGYNFGIERLFADVELTLVEWEYEFYDVPAGGWAIELYQDNVYIGGSPAFSGDDKTTGIHEFRWDFTLTPMVTDKIRLAGSSGGGQPGSNHRTFKVRLYGNGENPFGESNCE